MLKSAENSKITKGRLCDKKEYGGIRRRIIDHEEREEAGFQRTDIAQITRYVPKRQIRPRTALSVAHSLRLRKVRLRGLRDDGRSM